MTQDLTAQAIERAMTAARSGRMEEARVIADKALENAADKAPLHALLGMICARMGNLEGAIVHLESAHRERPDDITIACNLIAALIDRDRLAEALGIATPFLAAADPSLRVARYRGFLAQSLDQFEEAVEAYRAVVDKTPNDFESWNNLGNALAGLSRSDEAVDALRKAKALDPSAAPTRLNFASALIQAGHKEEAEKELKEAASLFPVDARPLNELYVHYKLEGRHEEALPAIEEAVRRDPNNASLQLKFGIECGLVHRTKDAETAFLRAIDVDPLTRDAYLGLAVQYEHVNRENDLRPLVDKAVAAGLDDGSVAFLDAMALRREKKYAEALERISAVDPEVEPVRTAHLRASVLDRLGRHDEAFEAFQATNATHESDPTDPIKRAAEFKKEIDDHVELLTEAWFGSFTEETPPYDGPSPVFLVGFPRSGTTLLDTILMGHPAATVMEEQPPLNLVDLSIGGMGKLPAMDSSSIQAARKLYFDEVAKVSDYDGTTLLIDKSPLYMQKVALIYRLFPNAKFILAVRHPCDVLLSCFMSNFRLNAAMANFLRLEDAAKLYDVTFHLWEQSRKIIPMNVHTVVYERMVTNLEGEMRALFDFLELDWHEDALNHTATAAKRGLITTASYSQVVQPIYQSSLGRWEGYRPHLQPIFPIVEPWVTKLGYSLEDPKRFPGDSNV